ncbi:MAG: hypothetical protein LC792_00930 [Actinobacteria bacterium]|nr:hypothetical protein [Actinomycetota bacterium]
MSNNATLEELADRLCEVVEQATRPPLLVEARALCTEAGVIRARNTLRDAPVQLAHAQEVYRQAQESERQAKEAHQAAVVEAEWDLDGRFVTEANRTFLTDADGNRKSMTADKRAKWKATEAARQPEVRAAADALRRAEHSTAAARDALAVAEKSFSAARADLDAAIATLNCLSLALPHAATGGPR